MEKLFIPSRIKVGYQKRDDTYTKRLSYIIYYDEKGSLRKESSWKTWCDSSIPSEEFDNKPHSGFVLNKGVQRYGYWGRGRNMVRVYDDRGMEFEITVNNLMFILMTTDCNKRGLDGFFVYAWSGKELILLPVGCEEYEESKEFTQMQAKKVSSKELIIGATYKTKSDSDIVYMGRFDWYEGCAYGYDERKKRPKQYIFHDAKQTWLGGFMRLSGLSSLAMMISDVPVSNYAALMKKLSEFEEVHDYEGFTIERFIANDKTKWDKKTLFVKESDGSYTETQIYEQHNNKGNPKGFSMNYGYSYAFKDNAFIRTYQYRSYGWNVSQKVYTIDDLKRFDFYTVFVKFEGGGGYYLLNAK